MKVTLKLLLSVAVVLLAYMCYQSIMTPIKFDKEKEIRDDAIIARLIEIRKAQIEYKNVKGTHAKTFDELANFLNTEKLPFLIKEGVLTDEQLEQGMTEQEAVKKGLIRRDTVWVLAKDTILGANYNVADMRYVPNVPASYLRDMDAQLTYNLIDKAQKQNKFPGLRVGSLEEINNNAGNWE